MTQPWGGRSTGVTGRLQHPEGIANRLYQPAGTRVWGDAEATGANPWEKEECQQTRRPAGHVIPGTGQAVPDKPPQGHARVWWTSGHAALTYKHQILGRHRLYRVPHASPSNQAQEGSISGFVILQCFLKSIPNIKQNLPHDPAGFSK